MSGEGCRSNLSCSTLVASGRSCHPAVSLCHSLTPPPLLHLISPPALLHPSSASCSSAWPPPVLPCKHHHPLPTLLQKVCACCLQDNLLSPPPPPPCLACLALRCVVSLGWTLADEGQHRGKHGREVVVTWLWERGQEQL